MQGGILKQQIYTICIYTKKKERKACAEICKSIFLLALSGNLRACIARCVRALYVQSRRFRLFNSGVTELTTAMLPSLCIVKGTFLALQREVPQPASTSKQRLLRIPTNLAFTLRQRALQILNTKITKFYPLLLEYFYH